MAARSYDVGQLSEISNCHSEELQEDEHGDGLWSSTDNLIMFLDPNSWHFGYPLARIIFYVAIAISTFWISLGGRKLVKLDLLEG